MHQYLRDEEAALMSQLKQEEEEKTQRMKDKIDKLNDDIEELTSRVRETEEAMDLSDFLLLKVSSAGTRYWFCLNQRVYIQQLTVNPELSASWVQDYPWAIPEPGLTINSS